MINKGQDLLIHLQSGYESVSILLFLVFIPAYYAIQSKTYLSIRANFLTITSPLDNITVYCPCTLITLLDSCYYHHILPLYHTTRNDQILGYTKLKYAMISLYDSLGTNLISLCGKCLILHIPSYPQHMPPFLRELLLLLPNCRCYLKCQV